MSPKCAGRGKTVVTLLKKAYIILFLSVPYGFLSGQAQSFRLCLGTGRYRKDGLWQQVLEVTKLTSEAVL